MALFAASAQGASAYEVIPVMNFSLLGGQYFMAGGRTSLNGNADANVAPAVKYSDRWTLLPVYDVNYQGTKAVTDPVGGGTIFQQVMDHRASVMGIYSMPESDWKLKPNASFKWEFMKETRDEAWGGGLFDYQKTGVGLEAENTYKDPFSYRLSYDFYYVHFPHYSSLESQVGTDPQGNPLGRQDAGKNVLDTLNNQITLRATRPYPFDGPKVSLEGSYSINYQTFPDAKLVNLAGQYQSNTRRDIIQNLTVGVAYPRPVTLWGEPYRLASRFNVGFTYDGSNQNEFDANNLKFVPDNYSYVTWSAGPNWALAWGDEKQPAWVSLGFTFWQQQYLGRFAQDAAGNYLSSNQYSNNYLLSLGYSYPIAPHFNLKAQTNFLWATSNMAFQSTYLYTYRTANYLFGFVYDY